MRNKYLNSNLFQFFNYLNYIFELKHLNINIHHLSNFVLSLDYFL